jgi:hypothetical protein
MPMQNEPDQPSGEQRVILEDYRESLKAQPIRDSTKDELKLANSDQQSSGITTQHSDEAKQSAIQGLVFAMLAAALLQVLTGILGMTMWYSALRWFPILIPPVLLIFSFFSIIRSIRLQSQSVNPTRVFILNCIGLLLAVVMSFYFLINIPLFINPTQHILDYV